MHASGAGTSLKQAVNDKNLSVAMAAEHALYLLNDPAYYELYYEVYTGERKNDSGLIAQEMKVIHDPKQLAHIGLNEGMGFVPFSGIGWEALRTIMKDRKSGVSAKATLISSLATAPDTRTNGLLLSAAENRNWVLRMAALEAIAQRGDPSLLSGVEPRLSDPRREVRLAAAATIIRLMHVAETQAVEDRKIRPAAPLREQINQRQ